MFTRNQGGFLYRDGRVEKWETECDDIFKKHTICLLYTSIIDDVLTTGATTTACADALKEVEGVRISVLTLAVAAS